MRRKQLFLSQLISSRTNPRRVKPDREAHARLVASLRTFGFFSSLVVKPTDDAERFTVGAGSRRLAALKEVHQGAEDVAVPCIVLNGESNQAEAMSLAENPAREPMRPLDESEAVAKLATLDGKGPDAIAAEFGVTEYYFHQRMKLSALAPVVKAAYRGGTIDTATAEAFSAVPEDRQAKVWEEIGGQPCHAQHVRSLIAHGWIDARLALFDISTLPEGAVTRDLFGDQVLIERTAFI